VLVVDGFVLRTFPPRGWSIALAFSVLLTGCHAVDDLFCGGGGCEWTEEEWTLALLKREGVLVQPGFFYDFQTEGHLVVSLLTAPAIFREGMVRLRRLVG